ncbi:MAG: histidine kinase [Methylobacter sp.]|nr:histidine kinase [Methylobacter sp.]
MSLRYQINLRIFISSLCILLVGGSIAIWQARDAVNKEIDSSINLTIQLISFGFSQASQTPFNETAWLPKFNSLNQTRHLSIQLKEPSGQIISLAEKKQQPQNEDKPPQWFINMVAAVQYPQVEHLITRSNGEHITLIIQATPLDEITEVWQEGQGFFSVLFLLIFFTFLAVNLAFNKALQSITIIVEALKTIETGHYSQQLPVFSILEYDSIAKAINHMTAELAVSQEKNRALTQHTLEIQEDERQRLSQELHDELGQSLTAIKVMAINAGRPQTDKANTKQAIDSIVSICDHLMTVVRSMMHQLHPLVLNDLGLKATLEDLINHWSLRNPQLEIVIDCPVEVDALEQKISIQLFRVIQECLTNTVRHAQASKATISLKIDHLETRTYLRLKVTDNGQGCANDKVKTGFGLLGIKERINSLGGEFGIESQHQSGMTVFAIIPLQ